MFIDTSPPQGLVMPEGIQHVRRLDRPPGKQYLISHSQLALPDLARGADHVQQHLAGDVCGLQTRHFTEADRSGDVAYAAAGAAHHVAHPCRCHSDLVRLPDTLRALDQWHQERLPDWQACPQLQFGQPGIELLDLLGLFGLGGLHAEQPGRDDGLQVALRQARADVIDAHEQPRPPQRSDLIDRLPDGRTGSQLQVGRDGVLEVKDERVGTILRSLEHPVELVAGDVQQRPDRRLVGTFQGHGWAIIGPIVPARLRFSIKTQQQHSSFQEMLPCWLEADQLDVYACWLNDHFMPPVGPDPTGRCEDGWTLLPALLARTQRVRGGVLATGNTYRHPTLLANIAATVDCLSDGRLEVALGAGWYAPEHEMYGLPLPSPGERVRRLDEACRVLKALWTEPRATFAGEYYQLDQAYCEPKPLQKPYPRLTLGVKGPHALGVAARQADEWNWVVPGGADLAAAADAYDRKLAELDVQLAATGRDPVSLSRSLQLKLSGSTAIDAQLAAAHIKRGVDHVVFVLDRPYQPQQIAGLWRELVPAIQDLAG